MVSDFTLFFSYTGCELFLLSSTNARIRIFMDYTSIYVNCSGGRKVGHVYHSTDEAHHDFSEGVQSVYIYIV